MQITLALLLDLAVGLAAVLASYRAIQSSRTPQGAVGWIVLILAFPYAGIPAYLIFGYANYAKYERKRRESDSELALEGLGPDAAPEPDDRLSVFERLAGRRALDGNGLQLLIDGDGAYDTLLGEIGRASDYVLFQFYTIEDDEVGRRFKDALIERARAGVKVFVLHDELPLVGLPRRYLRDLADAGVQLSRPKGPARALGPFQLNYRNHRKIVVVDGQEGFTGGMNISRTYIGQNRWMGQWRDTFARLTGPMVDQLQDSFAADWNWAENEDLRRHFAVPARGGDMRGMILSPAPTDRLNTGNLYFIALAQSAKRRLWITTPYFVPDLEVMAALQLAALRGVDLRILVPSHADHYLPYWAAFASFDAIRQAGGEIWQYEGAFLHQKVALVDDDLVSIGSINLDIRSGLLNFEVTAMLDDKAAATRTEEMLERDFASSHRLDTDLSQQPLSLQIAARVSRLISPVL